LFSSANIVHLTGQARMEHPFEFGSHHIHHHHTSIPDQHWLYCSIQRNWLSRSLCDPRNIYHFVHRAHLPSPPQGTTSSTTMDTRSLRYLRQYRSSLVSSGGLGLRVLPASNTGHIGDHELECLDIRISDDLCGRLLSLDWEEYV
jgi:hypothetical protein